MEPETQSNPRNAHAAEVGGAGEKHESDQRKSLVEAFYREQCRLHVMQSRLQALYLAGGSNSVE